LHERDGHLSAASWVAAVHRVPFGRARGDVQTARALGSMPLTRRAVLEGGISIGAARALVEARKAEPEAFARTEADLVRAAGRHTQSELQKVMAFWRQRAERDRGIDTEASRRERRNLHASVTWDGMVRVDGDLDPEAGETLLTALDAVLDAEAKSTKGDSRTRRNAARMHSPRSVAAGWTPPTAPAWVESDRTSP
jgi:hypothetical protein